MSKIAKYFSPGNDTSTIIFTGDKAICRIPLRYKDKNLLIVDATISTLGLIDIEVIDKGQSYHGGIILHAAINMDPSETYQEVVDGKTYFCCVLTKGDKFMTTRMVVQEESMSYHIYVEGISLANFPKFIDYNNIHTLFDDLQYVTGRGIPTNRAILELIYAQMYRDADDISKPYRLTPMDKPPVQLPFRDVAHHTQGTHARIIGGYADDGRNAALLNPNEQSSQFEDYFRT